MTGIDTIIAPAAKAPHYAELTTGVAASDRPLGPTTPSQDGEAEDDELGAKLGPASTPLDSPTWQPTPGEPSDAEWGQPPEDWTVQLERPDGPSQEELARMFG